MTSEDDANLVFNIHERHANFTSELQLSLLSYEVHTLLFVHIEEIINTIVLSKREYKRFRLIQQRRQNQIKKCRLIQTKKTKLNKDVGLYQQRKQN